jgi:hypothetical protein
MKQRNLEISVSVATLLMTLAAASTVAAQPPGMGGWGSPGSMPLASMDRNGDGWISEAEHTAFRAERMAARASEGRLMRNAARAPAFSDLDRDGDGRLNAGELRFAQDARFAGRGWDAGRVPGWGRRTGRPCWR